MRPLPPLRELAPDTNVFRCRVRCGCGYHTRNFRVVEDGLMFLRQCNPPPDLYVLSFYCNECKRTVAVTAGQMGLATEVA